MHASQPPRPPRPSLVTRETKDLDRKLAHVLEPRMRLALVREWLLRSDVALACALLSQVLARPPLADCIFDPLRDCLLELIAEEAEDEDAGLGYALRRSLYEAARLRGDETLARLLRSQPAPGGDDAPSRLPRDLADVPLGQRRSLARSEDRNLLDKLALDADAAVISNLLRNPRTREQDVVRIAALRPVAVSTLREIARSSRWSQQPRVRAALARNPACPIEIAVQVMGTLPLPDLRELSRDPDLPPATLAQARAELQRRGGIG